LSHVVQIQAVVRDPDAIRAACERLKLPAPVHGRHRLYESVVEGHAVQLPDWRYPIVCDVASGVVRYDNFGGHWGDQAQLDRFIQMYAVEKAKIEARRNGHTCTEQALADGSIKVTVNVGGGA
jgi:hypothetical protein